MKKCVPVLMTILLLAACATAAVGTEEPGTAPTVSASEPSGTPAPPVSATSPFTATEPVSGLGRTSASASGSSADESVPETSLLPEDYENEIVKTAEALLGIDFADGGTSPSEGFDNSGFIYYVLRKCGYVGCPRQISAQIEWGGTVSFEDLKPGDVAYFSTGAGGEKAEFGGIYAGGGVIIYSPYPGEKVKKADITTNYWRSRFVTALSL